MVTSTAVLKVSTTFIDGVIPADGKLLELGADLRPGQKGSRNQEISATECKRCFSNRPLDV